MTSAAEFVAWVGTERVTMGFKPEEYRTGALDRWFSVAGSVGCEELKKAYKQFLTDRYWRSQGCPWGGFVVRWREMLGEAGEARIKPENRSGWSRERLQKLQNEIEDLKFQVLCRERNLARPHCECGGVRKPNAPAGCGYCVVQKHGVETCLAKLDECKIQLMNCQLEYAKAARRGRA